MEVRDLLQYALFRKNHFPGIRNLAFGVLIIAFLACVGCGVINPGKWKGIETTAKDEKYYLVKDVFLTAGSAYVSKQAFDHNMNESINLVFTPVNEKNHYITETVWIDPSEQEFRTIRMTHDVGTESKRDQDRKKSGTPRVHSISTLELFNRKPGLWKVALYVDGNLARRLSFSVR
ncbi:MAG: hypothetical protein WCG29_10825 [Desulfomonile sp.]|jgi:hypothetical protein|nr:hypothetical protein [Deltaproteobacteria bacterium]